MNLIKKMLLLQIICVCSAAALLTGCSGNNSDSRPQKETIKGDVKSDQPTDSGNWFTKDPVQSGFEGTRSESAILDFHLSSPQEVIVAVIDSGVDINHEDLQNKIWQNPGETGTDASGSNKENNHIDDDLNGYIDDVHGWNFLGSADGKNVEIDTLEITREAALYDKLLASGTKLTDSEIKYYEDLKLKFENEVKSAQADLQALDPINKKVNDAALVLKQSLNITDLSKESLNQIISNNAEVLAAKKTLLESIEQFRTIARFFRIYNTAKNSTEYFLNKSYNSRALVGDDPDDFSQIHYGNNDVKGPDASHGTHVAGIIAANRNNGIGIDGIADHVKIMVLRVVPNGDERDKDITLAVHYAVDHGARIINMSFGKDYSPQKTKVDEAFLYASSKNVLLVHAAGNGASNNDLQIGYPNRTVKSTYPMQRNVEYISTWLEIGASAKFKGPQLVAAFSDYGKKDVDFFSPGVEIKSTTPNNTYSVFSGTSMAAPVTTGVAVLLLSNFPMMTALSAKNLILNHVRLYDSLQVQLPGQAADLYKVPFADLSATGGIIDAYNLIQSAF